MSKEKYKYVWVKYRTNHAWGSTTWEFKELKIYASNKSWKKNFAEQIHDQHQFSDKYRGVSIYIIKHPTKEYLLSLVKGQLERAKACRENAKRYKQLADKVKPSVKSDKIKKSV